MNWVKTSERLPLTEPEQTKVLLCTGSVVLTGLFTLWRNGDAAWAEYDQQNDRYIDAPAPQWWCIIECPKD